MPGGGQGPPGGSPPRRAHSKEKKEEYSAAEAAQRPAGAVALMVHASPPRLMKQLGQRDIGLWGEEHKKICERNSRIYFYKFLQISVINKLIILKKLRVSDIKIRQDGQRLLSAEQNLPSQFRGEGDGFHLRFDVEGARHVRQRGLRGRLRHAADDHRRRRRHTDLPRSRPCPKLLTFGTRVS